MATAPASQPATRSYVVGTAGHIDHGKSTLVRSLTGIDPDRLAEEKARGMTIDLGFAWLQTPGRNEVSIVDVPGHERFIKNMLAGVGGIDAAILVIAADEGPMPQTTEHLAILDLLQIGTGVVALTKIDAVDSDWRALVEEEVRERLQGTVLADAPIVGVSALTGEGLPELLTALDQVLPASRAPGSGGKARLPIDRVFSVTGFGTVVTGTLLGGELAVGQELDVMPGGDSTRVRGLQTHGAKVERALPGSRVAVNVANLAVDELHRGDVLCVPKSLKPSQRVDVRLRLLPDAPVALEQNTPVDFFVGAAERPAWLTLLDSERIEPGQTGWVQVRFRDPVAVQRGDRFIIRRPSPSVTIGGGEVIDPAPLRHRRFRPEVVAALETLAIGTPDELLYHALEDGPAELKALRAHPPSGLDPASIDGALEQLIAEGDVRPLVATTDTLKPSDYVVAVSWWERQQEAIVSAVAAFHKANSLRKGIPREELRSRLKFTGPARLFDDLLAGVQAAGALADEGATIRLPDFQIRLDAARQAVADRYLTALKAQPISPPPPSEFNVDAETFGAMVDQGTVVKVADGVIYAPEAYAAIEREVLQLIDRDGSMTLAGFRDHFQTSRKYAQAILEYLDQRRITRRVGDDRVRFAGAGAGQTVDGRG